MRAEGNGHEVRNTVCSEGVEIPVIVDRRGVPFSVNTLAAGLRLPHD
jgi:hypothetical protein